ncbi:MAG: hypothetical protein GY941_00470 [Planctomycetes bacterium]|nr:hypothetical protein [Planctomycetota bacterium]
MDLTPQFVVSEGDTYEEALENIKSAIKFHIEAFGKEVSEEDESILEVFVVETGVAI